MDLIGTLLWPIKWVIELILVAFHTMWDFFGLDPDAGITWVLSIVGLVIVVRAALIPIFVRQIKNQRRMLEVAPQLKKIQDKYKGKKDQFSREAMSRETMELYKKTGTNPLSSCLPLLLQMPIFFGLFSVLNDAQHDKAGVGALNQDLANSFANSVFLGAPLNSTFIEAWNNGGQPWQTMVVASIMIVADDRVAVHHAAADRLEEHVARDQGEPHVPPAAHPPLPAPARVRLLGRRVPHRRDVLLAGLELLDHGTAVRRHPEHADSRQ